MDDDSIFAEETTTLSSSSTSTQTEYYTVLYSSGTTGTPKGLGVTKRRWIHDAQSGVLGRLGGTRTAVSHAALAHGMDRGAAWQALFCGGRIGFARSDYSGLIADCFILRPTMLTSMPHFWSRLYQDYRAHVHELCNDACVGARDAASLADILCESVLQTPQTIKAPLAKTIRAKALAEFRAMLGEEIMLIGSGGAKTGDDVLHFLSECFTPAQVVDAYGTTEVPGISSNGVISDAVEVRLVDVPEQGYLNSDTPNPRGEIVVRSPEMVSRYWGESPEAEAATRANFRDGWYFTGDIGCIDKQTGKLAIIDRKGGLAELYVRGRSVWVSTAALETVFMESSMLCRSLYLHSDRSESSFIAVVVPVHVNVRAHDVLTELRAIGHKNKLKLFEIPRAVIVDAYGNPWSIETGELSATNKPCRAALSRKYKGQIDSEYARLEAIHAKKAAPLPDTLDFADFRFVADEQEDAEELNKLMLSVRDTALKLRTALPEASARQRTAETLARGAVSEAKQRGVEAVIAAKTPEEAITAFAAMREQVQCRHLELSELLRTADPSIKSLQLTLSHAIDELCEAADTFDEKVPFQIRSGAVVFSPEQMRARGGSCLAEAPGFENWQVWCCACGDLIEWGCEGSGAKRWKCLDCTGGPCVCDQCHSLLVTLSKRSLSAVIGFFPHITHVLVAETAHPIWLREAVLPARVPHSPAALLTNALRVYSPRPCLGMLTSVVAKEVRPAAQIAVTSPTNSLLEHDGFTWLSYGQVEFVATRLARGLLVQSLHPGDFVGICGDNTFEWAIADFACAMAGLRAFGIHTAMSSGEVARELELTCAKAMFCSSKAFASSVSNAIRTTSNVKLVVLLDGHVESNADPRLHNFFDVACCGNEDTVALPNPAALPVDGISGVFSLLFTSGTSTGIPEAAIVSAETFYKDIAIARGPNFFEPLITVSYIPLSHSSDRVKLWEFIGNGGRVAFVEYAHSNWTDHEQAKREGLLHADTTSTRGVENLFSAVSQLRPTAMSCPPHIMAGLYSIFKHRMAAGEAAEKIAREISGLFGDRLAFVVTEGAPAAPEIDTWIRTQLFTSGKVSFHDSYGATECGTNCGF